MPSISIILIKNFFSILTQIKVSPLSSPQKLNSKTQRYNFVGASAMGRVLHQLNQISLRI